MNRRRLRAGLALPAFALVACSSTTSGQGSTAAPGSPGAGSCPGTSTTAPPSNPTDAHGLAAVLTAGAATVTSAHIELNVTAGGQQITGAGDEQLKCGKLTGLDISESLPGGAGDFELIITGGKSYAKLPPASNPTSKPWVLVTPDSSNPTIAQLANSLQSTEASASITSSTAFVNAASSVKNDGPATVNGTPTTHWSVIVDPSRLPDSNPGKAALVQAGITSLPVELYVDSQGRPARVTENFTTQGQDVSTQVDVGRYNQPVSISAPPPDQVGRA
jgi:hypothetical protein